MFGCCRAWEASPPGPVGLRPSACGPSVARPLCTTAPTARAQLEAPFYGREKKLPAFTARRGSPRDPPQRPRPGRPNPRKKGRRSLSKPLHPRRRPPSAPELFVGAPIDPGIPRASCHIPTYRQPEQEQASGFLLSRRPLFPPLSLVSPEPNETLLRPASGPIDAARPRPASKHEQLAWPWPENVGRELQTRNFAPAPAAEARGLRQEHEWPAVQTGVEQRRTGAAHQEEGRGPLEAVHPLVCR